MSEMIPFEYEDTPHNLPGRTEDAGWFLYVAEIIDVGVKVGITRDPQTRIGTHRQAAEAHKRQLGRVWVSPQPHINAKDNERQLVGDSPREYLDATFEVTRARAERLPMTIETPAQRARSEAHADAFSKRLKQFSDSWGQQVRAGVQASDALAYVIHRFLSLTESVADQVDDGIAEELGYVSHELAVFAQRSLDKVGRSIDIYTDGTPVEPVVPNDTPGLTTTFIRLPGDPFTPNRLNRKTGDAA